MPAEPESQESWWILASATAAQAASTVHPPGPDRDALAASVADRLYASYRHVRSDAAMLARLAVVIARNADRAVKRSEGSRRRIREHGVKTGDIRTVVDPSIPSTNFGRSIREAVANLTIEERHLLTLRVEAGLGFVEMAEVTGVPISTLHQRFMRIRARLQEVLHAKAERDPELRAMLAERGFLRQ